MTNRTIQHNLSTAPTMLRKECKENRVSAANSGGGADKSGQSSSATATNIASTCAMHKTALMLLPRFPNYGKVMRHGCRGVASSVMKWPARMIIGGLDNHGQHHRHDHGTAPSSSALRSKVPPMRPFGRRPYSPSFWSPHRPKCFDGLRLCQICCWKRKRQHKAMVSAGGQRGDQQCLGPRVQPAAGQPHLH
ncbi:hypothetical protein niasHT_031474 [Heterodera trifolii]|uniref:Uncharacterized protein n=1 Tax=Heterodera trifolii TaxID=157864 RepID=A0ABD2IXR9_9BILA